VSETKNHYLEVLRVLFFSIHHQNSFIYLTHTCPVTSALIPTETLKYLYFSLDGMAEVPTQVPEMDLYLFDKGASKHNSFIRAMLDMNCSELEMHVRLNVAPEQNLRELALVNSLPKNSVVYTNGMDEIGYPMLGKIYALGKVRKDSRFIVRVADKEHHPHDFLTGEDEAFFNEHFRQGISPEKQYSLTTTSLRDFFAGNGYSSKPTPETFAHYAHTWVRIQKEK
jgi:hypothetical protein